MTGPSIGTSTSRTPPRRRLAISGLIEGLAGATDAVKRLGADFQWSDDKSFARDLLTGAAIQPLTEGLTPQEAEDTGAAALAQSTDPSGGAMRRFLTESGSGRGLSRISDKSAIRLAKKTWPIWESIGSLSRSELRISTPDFATNEGKFTPSKMIPVSTQNPLVDKESITELAGRLVRKGAQLAYKARAKQGKMVRKMILLSDALGIFGGGLVNDPRVIDRDDNLAKAISGGHGVGAGRSFPRGSPYGDNPDVIKDITEMLVREEKAGRLVSEREYRKFKDANTYRVVLISGPERGAALTKIESAVEMKQDEPQVPRTQDLVQHRRGRSESLELLGVSEAAKRQRIKDPPPRKPGRPLGTVNPTDRLRVRPSTVVKMGDIGRILKKVSPRNPESILSANEALTSSTVPVSTIVDTTAASIQSELVRDQNHEDQDRRVRLRQSCIQMGNAKSAAALDSSRQKLATMTARATQLSDTLIKERQVSTDKVKQIQGDVGALKRNLEEINAKWRETLGMYRDVKAKYDRETVTWQKFQVDHANTVRALAGAKQLKATTLKQTQHGERVAQSELAVLRRQVERYGKEGTQLQLAKSRLEDQIRVNEQDNTRVLEERDRQIRDVEARLKQEKIDNFELNERNERLMEEQARLRLNLEAGNASVAEMQQQVDWIGRDNDEKDRNVRDLTNSLREMEAEVEQGRQVALSSEMRAMVAGKEAMVAIGGREREQKQNRELMWANADMRQDLGRMEEEVLAGRSQCPWKAGEHDVDMTQASGGMGGKEGGGFQGEGGSAMRAKAEWMGDDPGVAQDYGDSDYGDIGPYTVTDADPKTDTAAMVGILLLLVVVAIYIAYR